MMVSNTIISTCAHVLCIDCGQTGKEASLDFDDSVGLHHLMSNVALREKEGQIEELTKQLEVLHLHCLDYV